LFKRWSAVSGLVDRSDVLTSLGVIVIAIGLWDVYRPAAFVVAGLVLVWCGLPPRPPLIRKG
jgi:hypothetical protein